MAERRINWRAVFDTHAAQAEAKKLARELEKTDKTTQAATDGQEDYSESLDNSTANTRKLRKALTEAASAQKRSADADKDRALALNKVKRAEAAVVLSNERLVRTQKNAAATTGQLAKAEADLKDRTLSLAYAQEEYNKVLKGHTRDVDRHGRALDRLTKKQAGAAQSIRNFFTYARALRLVLIPLLGLIPAVATAVSSLAAGAVALVSALGPAVGLVAAAPAGFLLLGQTIGGVALAFMGLKDALKASSEALKATTPQQAIAANQKLAEAYKGMTPAARRFTEQLIGMKSRFDALRKGVQEAALPFFAQALKNATPLLDAFHGALQRVSMTVGRSAAEGAGMMAAGPFRRDLVDIMDNNTRALDRLLDGLWMFVDALRHVSIAAAPMITWMSTVIQRWGEMAQASAEAGRESGRMQSFFERAVKAAQVAGTFLKNIWDILIAIGRAATDLGNDMWDGINKGTRAMADFLASAGGQNKLRAWFDAARQPLHEMWLLVKAVGDAFNQLAIGGQEGLSGLIATLRTKLLPFLVKILNALGTGMTPAFLELINSLIDLFNEMGGAMTIALQAFTSFVKVITWLITHIPLAGEALTAFLLLATGIKIKRFIEGMGALREAFRLVGSQITRLIPMGKNLIASLSLVASGPGGLSAIATTAGVAAGALAALGIAVIGTGKILVDAWAANKDRQRQALSDNEQLLTAIANNVQNGDAEVERLTQTFNNLMNAGDLSAEGMADLQTTYDRLMMQIENGNNIVGTASQEAYELADAEEAAAAAARRVVQEAKRADRAWQRMADNFAVAAANRRQAAQDARSADRAASLAAEGLADAHEAVSDAQRELEDAHVAVADAQEALTEARRDATYALIDLRTEVRRMGLEEESSKLSLLASRKALQEVMNDENSTAIQRRQAVLSVRSAEHAYADTLKENRRTRQELNEAEKKGVEGSDQVVNARKALRDAIEGVSDSQRALVKAQREAADAEKANTKAQRANTRAQEALAKAVTRSNRMFERMAESGMFQDIRDEYESLSREGKSWMERLRNANDDEIEGIMHKMGDWRRRSQDFATKIGGVMESLKKGVGSPLAFVQNQIIGKFLKNIEKISGTFGKNIVIPELEDLPNVQQYHEGGTVGKDGTPHKGPIRGNEQLAVLEKGEQVISRRHLPQSRRKRRGGPGDRVSNTGGSTFQSIIAYAQKSGIPSYVTSTYRSGDPGYHGRGMAVDFAHTPENMMRLNKAFAKIAPYMTELIHTPGVNLWHGRPHTYSAAVQADHYDHVHVAAVKQLWDAVGGKIPEGALKGSGLYAALAQLEEQARKQGKKGVVGGMGGTMALYTGRWAKQYLKGHPSTRRHWSGGLVSGASGIDNVPALLSDGEFVLRRAAVAKIGVANLQAMNDNAAAFFGGLATGGFVSRPSAPAPSSARVHSVTSQEAAQGGSGASGAGGMTAEITVDGVTLAKSVNLTNGRNKILLKDRV